MKADYLIAGVDIGGSHITTGLIDMNDIKLLKETVIRRRLNSQGSAEEILKVWIETLKDVIAQSPVEITKIGFAMPGPFDYEKGICRIKGFNKYEALYEMNIRNILSEALQLEPENILFRNDAEAFLDGELLGGAAKGFLHAIGITLGTGLGSSISHNGITVDAELSVTNYQGEIIEEFVSTRGLLRTYKELTGKMLKEAKQISDRYETDIDARKTFSIFSQDLSWFLQKFISQENPDVLVIGGNIINSWDLFMNDVIKHLEFTVTKMPVIVKALLGEDAALIGGACNFQDQAVHIEK